MVELLNEGYRLEYSCIWHLREKINQFFKLLFMEGISILYFNFNKFGILFLFWYTETEQQKVIIASIKSVPSVVFHFNSQNKRCGDTLIWWFLMLGYWITFFQFESALAFKYTWSKFHLFFKVFLK
jgi:hypothetical protein